ncbi:cyclin-Q-like [Penaeus japonicus]|uniref:cyclin-Q-like n=1 Tax=Penaeus japonicus TaxID=27405 RepID=UPI001C70D256|nr:cyclin-Q-like [Penaeus japonicus]
MWSKISFIDKGVCLFWGSTGQLLLARVRLTGVIAAVSVSFTCVLQVHNEYKEMATAATYYHKFYEDASLEEYDPYLIGCTCLYLASKVEDDDIKIRDIINVGINCVRRGEPPLSLDPYFCMRDSLIQAELLLMRFLGLMQVDLPHKYLLHYIQSVKDWLGNEVFDAVPIIQLAWTVIQDVYHSPIVLKYPPQVLSAAILNLVVQAVWDCQYQF